MKTIKLLIILSFLHSIDAWERSENISEPV